MSTISVWNVQHFTRNCNVTHLKTSSQTANLNNPNNFSTSTYSQTLFFLFVHQNELYEICLSTCDDGQDGHDLFPNEPNMAGDR